MRLSTNWLKDFVPLSPPLERIAERLTMAGLEVKRIEPRPDLKDTVFEVEVTTNRPDWLSHWGVAREIRAVENAGLKPPPAENPPHQPMPSGWKLHLKEAEGCPYYTASLLEGVEWGETPEWMRKRLLACGLRSINLLVDITNYVLLEVGQPLHAFDADLLQGKEVQIRRAKSGETIVAIDGTSYPLKSEDLVIADRDRAVALAGIMGGRETEVTERTRNILLESAFFDPRWVRKSSRRLGLSSESSYRFERRVDPEGVDGGRERAIYLFREIAGVRTVSAVLKAGQKPGLPKSRIHLSLEEIEKVLGMKVKPHEVHSALIRLGLEAKNEGPEIWGIRIPSYRADLERPIDLVEEVARIVGYENIPESLPERAPLDSLPLPLRILEEKTRDFLAGAGLFETVTSSLVNPNLFEPAGVDLKGSVRIQNPIHAELTLLRPSFLISFLEVLARNERGGERSLPIFEAAPLYFWTSKGEAPREEKTLGILLSGEREAGWSDSKRPLNFFDLKGLLESYLEWLGIPNFSFTPESYPFFDAGARIEIGKERVGYLGEVARSIRAAWDLRTYPSFAELSLEKVLARLPAGKPFKEIPRFPPVERDLALVVDESVQASEVFKTIRELGGGLVRKIELFDLFRGGRIPKGKKNLAFRLLYQSPERTLLSEEVQCLHEGLAREIAQRFQAEFQGK